jgi:hypothetical protein
MTSSSGSSRTEFAILPRAKRVLSKARVSTRAAKRAAFWHARHFERPREAILRSVLPLLLIAWFVLISLTGCATAPPARTPVLEPPPPPETGQGPVTAEPVKETIEPAQKDIPLLPGAMRVYPSQDPRNQAPADAPEAFPLAGATGWPGTASSAKGGESTPPAATESTLPVAVQRAEPNAPTESAPPARVGAIEPGPSDHFSVQLFASTSGDVARRRMDELAPSLSTPLHIDEEGGLFKVRLGELKTRREAERLRKEVLGFGFRDAFVVSPTPMKKGSSW